MMDSFHHLHVNVISGMFISSFSEAKCPNAKSISDEWKTRRSLLADECWQLAVGTWESVLEDFFK